MENTDLGILKKIWAKSAPFQSIIAHSFNTAAVARGLLTEGTLHPVLSDLSLWIFRDQSEEHKDAARSLMEYLAALHDIGKIHPAFLITEDKKGVCELLESTQLVEDYHDEIKSFRHEKYSKTILERIWKAKKRFENEDKNDSTVRYFSDLESLHHQGKSGQGREIPDEKVRGLWQRQQDVLEEVVFELFRPPSVTVNSKVTGHVSAICMQMLGTIILSDWLASSAAFSEEELKDGEDLSEYYFRLTEKSFSLIKGSRVLRTELPAGTFFPEIWTGIPREKMRSLQKVTEELMADEKKPLLFIIEAPMGEGKTEAGTYAAFQMGRYYRKEGFYIAMPTSATADQMYHRMRDLMKSLFPDKEVRLLHSLAWLTDRDTREEGEFDLEDRECAMKWTQPLRRGLLEGYSVGTIDQALMAALYVKYGAVRLLGIGCKTLILDEVHAYDAYMEDILIKLLAWCRELRVPVVILSATLPNVTKKEILKVYGIEYQKEEKEYPAVTSVFEDGKYATTRIPDVSSKKTVQIELARELNIMEAVSLRAVRMVEKGGCVCVLVNTVGTAQKLYETIKRNKPEELRLYLFHAAYAVRRRQQIEEEIVRLFGKDKTERPAKAILIATQVVEQSIDVDFDSIITEIAPIDLLLQRMGRIFRHDDTPRPSSCMFPRMTVLIPEEGADYGLSGIVYPRILLDMTWQYLTLHSQIHCPESIQEAVESVYAENAGVRINLEEWMAYRMDVGMKHSQAKIQELPAPSNKFKIYKTVNRIEDLFDDGESNSFLSAKTRLIEPTLQIAIVPPEIYDKAVKALQPSKELAKEVYRYSVSVAERRVKKFYPEFQKAKVLQGNGLLKNILIFPGEAGSVKIREDVVFELGDELGFIIREDENIDTF